MQISPKVSILLNIIYGVLTLLSVPILNSLGFTDNASVIYAWALFGAGFVNLVLHAFTNSQPGPFSPQDPDIVKAVAAGASPKTVLALAQDTVNASPAPSAPTEPNSPLQPKG